MTRDAIPADELVKKARAVGQYYGFTPLASLTALARGKNASAGDYPEAVSKMTLDPTAETVASFLKQCKNAGFAPSTRQPLFVWHTNIAAGRTAPKRAIVQFHAIGSERPLADAVVIRAALALARDLYRDEPTLRLNSMGDRETRARYARELGSFFKRHAADVTEECATCAKRDAMEAAQLALAQNAAIELPSPTDHLSDASRKRFEDLLEYLEATSTPYELAKSLISRGGIWSESCFEIRVGEERVAWGSRYGDLARHFFATPVAATGVIFSIPTTGPAVKAANPARARIAFVHIGEEAKRLSIGLAEEFKKARVPLAQEIGTESLAEQLSLAERRNPAYLLIMGRKEALEHSAILRNRTTQEETVISLDGIADRLRAFA